MCVYSFFYLIISLITGAEGGGVKKFVLLQFLKYWRNSLRFPKISSRSIQVTKISKKITKQFSTKSNKKFCSNHTESHLLHLKAKIVETVSPRKFQKRFRPFLTHSIGLWFFEAINGYKCRDKHGTFFRAGFRCVLRCFFFYRRKQSVSRVRDRATISKASPNFREGTRTILHHCFNRVYKYDLSLCCKNKTAGRLSYARLCIAIQCFSFCRQFFLHYISFLTAFSRHTIFMTLWRIS